jgi:transposase-like protein
MRKHGRRSDPQREREWQAAVRRWQRSGQSVREYCRAQGLKESAFYFWRRELARRGRQAAGNGPRVKARSVTPGLPPAQRVSRPRRPTPSFLPVHLVEPAVAGAARGVEVVLERGRTVRVPAGFDRQTLADVLAVLEVRSC